MDNEDRPFIECIAIFAQHDYERAANVALNLLNKRMFLWVMQLMLISLERNAQYKAHEAMTEMALKAFGEHPWAVALIQLSLGLATADKLRAGALDGRQTCQLDFYDASRHLTLGDREAAVSRFRACAASPVKCPEQHLAESELEMPEPPDEILERLARQVVHPANGTLTYDFLTCGKSALQILRSETIRDNSLVLPLLEILMIRLKEVDPSIELTELLLQIDEVYRAADEAWIIAARPLKACVR